MGVRWRDQKEGREWKLYLACKMRRDSVVKIIFFKKRGGKFLKKILFLSFPILCTNNKTFVKHKCSVIILLKK